MPPYACEKLATHLCHPHHPLQISSEWRGWCRWAVGFSHARKPPPRPVSTSRSRVKPASRPVPSAPPEDFRHENPAFAAIAGRRLALSLATAPWRAPGRLPGSAGVSAPKTPVQALCGPQAAPVEAVVRPTPERERHGAVEPPEISRTTFRPGWRAATRLDQLLASRRISRAAWQAGADYRTLWEQLAVGGPSSAGSTLRLNVSLHDRLPHGIEAAAKLRRIEARLEAADQRLCYACVVEDRSWAATGRKFQCNPETARDWTAKALERLAAASR